MSNKFNFRILNDSDLNLIALASSWQATKYGYTVDKKVLEDRIIKFLSQEATGSYAIGCFNGDELIGINTHVAWKALPFWSFSGLIIKPDTEKQGIMSSSQISVLAQMLEFNCSLGEKNSRFEWVTVTQDSTHQLRTRHNKIMHEIYKRYTGVDLNIIVPGRPLQYPYLEYVLDFPHKKPLVVKLFSLKNELRPANWINFNNSLK